MVRLSNLSLEELREATEELAAQEEQNKDTKKELRKMRRRIRKLEQMKEEEDNETAPPKGRSPKKKKSDPEHSGHEKFLKVIPDSVILALEEEWGLTKNEHITEAGYAYMVQALAETDPEKVLDQITESYLRRWENKPQWYGFLYQGPYQILVLGPTTGKKV